MESLIDNLILRTTYRVVMVHLYNGGHGRPSASGLGERMKLLKAIVWLLIAFVSPQAGLEEIENVSGNVGTQDKRAGAC